MKCETRERTGPGFCYSPPGMVHVPRVKICGIANLEDARTAIACGADALGFLVGLVYPTGDELTAERARELVAALPPFVNPVLVTHQSDPEVVAGLVATVAPHVVQLHGAFAPEDISRLRARFPHLKILKAVHVDGEGAVDAARRVAPLVDGILLDTRTATRLGGTGLTHDWSIDRCIREALPDTPVILAGGLNPDNVVRAIETVRPYGVDVNTGVSIEPGRKSPELLKRFLQGAKRAVAAPVAR